MTILSYTESNKKIIQDFIDETRQRINNGLHVTFTNKAQSELKELNFYHDVTPEDVENAILNLTVEDYFRGIDPSRKADFEVCAFYAEIGADEIGIYLKYGLETNGLQILIFSNHIPLHPMQQPFKKSK